MEDKNAPASQVAVSDLISVFEALSRTNTGRISVTVRHENGGDSMVMSGLKRLGEPLHLRYYKYADREHVLIKEVTADPDYQHLTADLLGRITASNDTPNLTEVELRFDYPTESLAPAARVTWGIGQGRIELGKPF